MRTKTITYWVLTCIVFIIASCYKTGEIIPQSTCKPIELTSNLEVYGRSGPGNYKHTIFYDQGKTRVNMIQVTNASSILIVDFIFEYDVNNNLVKYKAVDYTLNGTSRIYWYLTFTYPAGTTNSYSDHIYEQAYFLNNSNTYDANPIQLYEFNTEYQLTRTSINGVTQKTYQYDFGGNLVRNDTYQSNSLYEYWLFDSYDNKINFARADRSLQLFYDIYSKNNPTATRDFYLFGTVTPVIIEHSGTYTYNTNGNPITFNGNFLASYDCNLPPSGN